MSEKGNTSKQESSATTFIIINILLQISIYVVFTGICQVICIFGIITNIINIVCFVKQGIKDSINISLLGLSVADLCSLLTLIWTCISVAPAFIEADLPFESLDVMYLVSGMPHFAFTRVSSYITAMITLERCISIVAPLKVKHIMTPQKSGIIVVCIFIIFIFSCTPVYVVNRLGRKFSLLKNKTTVGLIFREDKEQVEKVTLTITNFFIPVCAFVIVAVSTAVLSIQLRRNAEWRKRTTSDAQADRISSRNMKVSKMVVTLAILFIVCLTPATVIMLAVAFEPELSVNGNYMDVTIAMGGFVFIFESINSSVNIFIYNHMSTKYRDTLQTLCVSKTFRDN